MKTKHPHPRQLSGPQRRLIDDIQAGGVLRRRGQGPDQNYWLGGRRAYVRSPRAVADALVRAGLARWEAYEAPHTELATHRLVLTLE